MYFVVAVAFLLCVTDSSSKGDKIRQIVIVLLFASIENIRD